MDKLGNFLMSVFYKIMPKKTRVEYEYHLSTKVISQTKNEMNMFLNSVLVNITGEKDLTWNLLNAMDLILVTGIEEVFHTLCTYIYECAQKKKF